MTVVLLVVALTVVVERYSGEAYATDIRAIVASDTDSLARHLSDLIASESASVGALIAFVESHADDGDLGEKYPGFAAALMELGETIKSVQVAPNGILEHVFPIEGNEEAVGLDLMADESRRILLEAAIESGSTVIQGPVELVQGGTGLIVRRPIYIGGEYWGFSAVVLDWPAVSELSGLESTGQFDLAGIKLADSGEVIAGSPTAFEGDPVIRELDVGGTDTAWLLAQRPVDGWPTHSGETPIIWAAGMFLALLAGIFSFSVIRRPEMLRRERQKALDELHALEARYRATFENAGVGIVLADSRGVPISANPKFREIVGIGPNDPVVDVDILAMLGESDRQAYLAGMRRLFAGAPVFEVEVRLMTVGVDSWCRVRTSLMNGSTPAESLVIAVVEDSTEKHQAEELLAASELRYRQLFELAPIAIQREDHTAVAAEIRSLRRAGVTNIRAHAEQNPKWLQSLLARVPIVDENPAAVALQETIEKQGARVTLLDRYTKEAETTFIESIAAIDEGRDRITQSVDSRRSDGSPLYLNLKWQAPVTNGVPDYSNVMVTLSDVTELRETERRLRALMDSKDRFLATVAHELRTPLTAVVGFAQELRDHEGIYSSREKSEFQELIAFHGAEMANIIEDLLVWARGDIGEVQVLPEAIDLTQCVKSSLRLMPQVEIPVEFDRPVWARADPTRVRQIARNLATNAMRHGGDTIQARVTTQGGFAVVEVKDDGKEIAPSVARRMFEPYERGGLDASKPGSIGLGLTVARTLARLQQGDLVYVRDGACNAFRITLPLAAPEDRPIVASGLASISE